MLPHADGSGRVLLSRRPAHKVRGGLWEFPGGKLEPGEAPEMALRRELAEELGIEISASRRQFGLIHVYPDLEIRLHVCVVQHWSGEPQPLEGQELVWQGPQAPDAEWPALSEADQRLRRWLRLPTTLVISADCVAGEEPRWLKAAASVSSDALLLVRTTLPTDSSRRLCSALLARRPGLQTRLLLSGDWVGAAALQIGVQWKSAQLRQPRFSLASDPWCGASCHDAEELSRAAERGCDYAVLGPVHPTASHPDAPPLGWPTYARLVRDSWLPVFALGGMSPSDLQKARALGGYGVAGIRGFWPTMPTA